MRLMGYHQGRAVTPPASRGTLKLHATTGEWQRYLERVVGVNTGRFTRAADPEASAAPEQDPTSCRCLHKLRAAARVRPLSNQPKYPSDSAIGMYVAASITIATR